MVHPGNNKEEFEIMQTIKQFIKGVTKIWQNDNHYFLTFKAFVPLGGKFKNKGDAELEHCNNLLRK